MNFLTVATMDDSSLHFARPVWLLVGLLVCAGVIALFIRFDRRRDADLAKLIHPRFRQRLTEGYSPRLRNLKRGLWVFALWLAFAAIARPQMGYEWREVKRKGIDILFAVDTSRSMLAEDLAPNRLERARLGILDFVSRLEGDRVGLIPFAGSAFALCPLTLDYDAFRESLDALDTDLIPRQGTDLASAIKEAGRLFEENGNNHRVLVLLTDGEDLQGDVIDAASEAAKNGMAIYTVGVGSPEGGTIPVRLRNGRTDFVRDESGAVVKTTLDETTLKKIAEATSALYVPLGRGAEGLNTIYQEKLRLVPKTEMDQRMERIPLERFEWPLGAAIALFLLEFLIGDRKRAKVPALAACMLFASGMQEVRSEPDARWIYNQGTEAYSSGDFAKAAESLRSSLKTRDLSLQQRAYYNLGNTLYRTGQGTLEKDPDTTIKSWEAAIKAYGDALALDASDADAKFNKELVERKLEELKQQQQQQQQQQPQNKDQDRQEEKDQQEKKEKDSNEPQDSQNKDSKEGEDSKAPQESKSGEPKEEEKSEGNQKNEDGKDAKQDNPQNDGDESADSNKGKKGNEAETQEGETAETMSNERGEKQEMTAEEAKRLLEALRSDERTVIPIPQPPRGRLLTPDNSTKGKTW